MATVTDTLRALADGDRGRAAALARGAAPDLPDSRLAAALDSYLRELPDPDVYDEPTAFEAFIDHGGNPQLYRWTIAVVAEAHARFRPRRLLDVGCGDGRVTAATRSVGLERIDLVEPSAELLRAAVRSVGRGPDPPAVRAHAVDIARLLDDLGDVDDLARPQGEAGWDLVQSTFALHTIEPGTRPRVLAQLREHAPALVVVEFDVPDLVDGSDAHLRHLAERYELGVREYDAHPEVVTGFLLPVLVGQLDPGRPRFTFEQPIERWRAQLTDAGWHTSVVAVDRYWWADAVAVVATAG